MWGDADYVARATMRISKCLRADKSSGDVSEQGRAGGALLWQLSLAPKPSPSS